MDTHQLLRYSISDVHQLVKCESNTSRDLVIHVTDFVQDDRLKGVRISLEHTTFGVLFATVIHSSGSLYLDSVTADCFNEMSVSQILSELARYGYCIEWEEYKKLSGDQIQFLMTLNQLGFEKIRILPVWHLENHVKVFSNRVVTFNSDKNPDWLNNNYAASDQEFKQSLANGSAFNVTEIGKLNSLYWNWLYGWVASINDILAENAESV